MAGMSYKLDRYITQNGSTLPQVVRVTKGFCGPSLNHTIDPGEVLIIYRVQRDRKVLARDFKGRELCLSKCDWKVKVLSDSWQQEYDTLVNVPSRYFRVLHDITSFRLFAGDILLFMRDPPHHPKARTLRCCLSRSRERVYLDLPANLPGTFQALPNDGIISMEHVLKECSLPVKANLMHERQNGTSGSAEEETTPTGNVQIDREIEEDTVFAISPSKNSILLFPKSLDITVTQLMSQYEFVSSKGTEYAQFLRAIENDHVLPNAIGGSCVYFTSEPIRCYHFKTLFSPSFRTGERIPQELITEATLEFPVRHQKAVFKSESNQPCSFSEKPVPPLPPKMLNSTAEQYQFTAKKNQVQHTESKQESEKQENFTQERSKQEVSHNLSFLVQRKSHNNTSAGTTRPSTLVPRTEMQFSNRRDNSVSESEEDVFSACKPQCGVNTNSVIVNSSMVSTTRRKGALTNHLEPEQPPCHKPCWLSEVNTAAYKKTTHMTKRTELTMNKHSVSSVEQRESDEGSETQLSPDLFISTQNDFSQTWQDRNFVTYQQARQKEFKMNKCSESSAEQSLSEEDNEDNEDCDSKDISFFEKRDFQLNIPEKEEKEEEQGIPTNCVNQGEPAEDNMKMYRTNEDNTKKSLFQSLTRRPRWFRQEAGKSGKREKRQASNTKSEAVRISPRNASSCEDLWISSPKEDDFECMSSITKYLETKEKLTRALVTINSLEKKGLESTDTMSENTNDLANSQERVSDEERKGSKKKENVAKPKKNLEDSQDTSKQVTDVQSKTIISRDILSEETSQLLTPVPDYPKLECEGSTFHNSIPNVSRENTEGMSYNLQGGSTSYDDSDKHTFVLPSFGPDRHVQWQSKYQSVEREDDEKETSSCARNLGVLGGELSESATKRELKKAILKMKWTNQEWAELTEAVRRKCNDRKPAFPPYVNLLSNGRERCISTDQTFIDTPKTLDGSMRRGMPPYVNIAERDAIQGLNQRAGQGSVNEIQRLANLSLGKPPIPTPRSGRSSV